MFKKSKLSTFIPKLNHMSNFNYENYLTSIQEWENNLSNYSEIERIIPLPYVFSMTPEQIDQISREDEDLKNFRLEIGIFNDQLIMILVPRDSKGVVKVIENYTYITLAGLENDLELKEIQQYTLINRSVLSKDLTRSSVDSDLNFPILSRPAIEQQVAVKEIEEWRDSGMEWFRRECDEFEGKRIFKRFFIAKEDLLHNRSATTHITCSFALKFSDIYQRMLVTLVFISFQQNALMGEIGTDLSVSNTYDYARPCPPVC